MRPLPSLLITLFVAAVALFAESRPLLGQGTVTGVVLSQETQRPMSGVQVSIAGASIGALSNAAGRYLIASVPVGQQTVVAQSIGYRTQEQTVAIAAGQTAVLNFMLSEQAVGLDEIIVTGTPGGTQRRAIGNDVASVAVADRVQAAVPVNVQNLLAGKAAGVNIQLAKGEVGSRSPITIRGAGSVTLGSEPILIVDGVRVNNGRGGTRDTRDSQQTSRMTDFNPDDIQSIEIIKGPAAATLYGTEASAGVVQIITKRGAAGEPTFDLTVRRGVNVYMDGEEKLNWFSFINPTTKVLEKWHPIISDREGGTRGMSTDSLWRAPAGSPDLRCSPLYNPADPDPALCYRAEWVQQGPVEDYQLSLSGGRDEFKYFVSANHSYEEGYVAINHMKDSGVRVNLDAVLTDDIRLQVSSGLTQSDLRSAQHPSPYSIQSAIGGYSHPLRRQTRGWYAATPEQEEKIHNTSAVDRATFSVQVQHTPYSWLTNRVMLGHDRTNEVNDLIFEALPEGASHPVFASRALGDVTREVAQTIYVSADLSSTARFNVTPNIVSATSAGAQYYKNQRESNRLVGRNFPAPGLTALDAAAEKVTLGGDWEENASVGLYVQQQVEWNNRVFLTGAIRGDDNSAFGTDYDAAIYPKLSAAWVLSEEPFFDVGFVNSLRLRAAWGKAGRQPSTFAAVSLYTPVTGTGNQPAVRPGSLGNEKLGPEVGEEIEAGFDAGFLDDRLGVNFTFYNKDTRDALIAVAVPPSTGFLGSRTENIGLINNRGIELQMDAALLQMPRLRWDMGFNLTTNRNRIVDLGEVPPTASGNTRNVEGYPVGSRWFPTVVSAEWQGDPFSGKAINAMCKKADGSIGPCAASGTEDVIYQGRSNDPKWWGGVSSTVTLFNNLQLYGNVAFMGGHLRTSCPLGCSHPVMKGTDAINGDPQNGVHPDPVVWFYSRSTNSAFSGGNAPALQTHKAGFVRVRDLSATYTLPSSLAQRVGASRASVNFAANNLWFLWQETERHFGQIVGDPEVGGSDYYLRTSLVGTVKLTF